MSRVSFYTRPYDRLEPYDGKLSRTVLRREGGGNTADPADYAPLVERLHGVKYAAMDFMAS